MYVLKIILLQFFIHLPKQISYSIFGLQLIFLLFSKNNYTKFYFSK